MRQVPGRTGFADLEEPSAGDHNCLRAVHSESRPSLLEHFCPGVSTRYVGKISATPLRVCLVRPVEGQCSGGPVVLVSESGLQTRLTLAGPDPRPASALVCSAGERVKQVIMSRSRTSVDRSPVTNGQPRGLRFRCAIVLRAQSSWTVRWRRINLHLTNIGQWFVPHPPQQQWVAQIVAWKSAARRTINQWHPAPCRLVPPHPAYYLLGSIHPSEGWSGRS